MPLISGPQDESAVSEHRYDGGMQARMLDRGVYDLDEISRLLAMPSAKVVAWANESADGLGPIVPPTFDRAFSFADLVSFRVALTISDHGVSDSDLRRGVALLREQFATNQPLADEHVIDRLAVSGKAFLAHLATDGPPDYVDLGKGRHGVIQDVIKLYLKRIRFSRDGSASAWQPTDSVLLDPRIQAGAPCVAGTRIPTKTISELLLEESVEEVAAEFGISAKQVRGAADFQASLDNGFALAA